MSSTDFTLEPRGRLRLPPAWRAESRALIGLAGPLILTELSGMAMYTTDIIMMGWISPEALAAGALGGHYFGFFYFFGLGLMAAVSPMVAQAVGARQYRHVRRSVRQGLWAAAALAVPCGLAIWHAGSILALLGQVPALAADAQAYLRAMVWGFVPVLWFLALSHFLAAHSRPRPAMMVSFGAVALNALLNYGLMFGNFGLPALGLVGAGVSSAIVDWIMMASLLAFVLQDRRLKRYHVLVRIWRADWARFAEVFRLGLPIACTILAETGMFLASGLLVGLLGVDQLAGHAVALQCAALAFMVPYGIAQAATVRVGLAVGSGRTAGVAMAARLAFAWGCGFALVSAAVFVMFGRDLVSIFLDPADSADRAAIAFAVQFLAVAAVFQLADAAQAIAAGCLRGLKDTRVPLALAVVGYWACGFTAAALLGFGFELGGLGIWIGLALGLAVAAVLLGARFVRRVRALTAPTVA